MAVSVRSSEELVESELGSTDMEEEQKQEEDREEEEEEEEEEDLFEINLDIVDNFPPPQYWESYVTATGNTLFANCLLPIADVSCAIPMVSEAGGGLPWPGLRRYVYRVEPMEKLRFSSLGAFGMVSKKM